MIIEDCDGKAAFNSSSPSDAYGASADPILMREPLPSSTTSEPTPPPPLHATAVHTTAMNDKENISSNIPSHSLDSAHPALDSNKTAGTVDDAKAVIVFVPTHTPALVTSHTSTAVIKPTDIPTSTSSTARPKELTPRIIYNNQRVPIVSVEYSDLSTASKAALEQCEALALIDTQQTFAQTGWLRYRALIMDTTTIYNDTSSSSSKGNGGHVTTSSAGQTKRLVKRTMKYLRVSQTVHYYCHSVIASYIPLTIPAF